MIGQDRTDGPPLRPPWGTGATAATAPGRVTWPLRFWPPGRAGGDAACAAAPALSRRRAITLVALVLALALLPVALARVPPLTDYPIHIARLSILDHWRQWPGIHAFYQPGSFLLPNLAIDLVLLGTAKLLPLELAGRVFLALTLVLMLSGTVALHWSLYRRWSLWPLAAGLFLHNWILVFGFLNYLFGIGLMLWGLAFWRGLASRPGWQRLLGGSLIAVTLYFAHMVAFGLYALGVAGYELHRAWADRRSRRRAVLANLALAGVPLLGALLVFLLGAPTREAGDQFSYAPEWYWKGFVVARTFMSMNLGLDILTAGTLLVVAIAVLLRGRVLFAREMAVGAGLMVLAFLALPWKLFGAVFVDARIPVALIFVVIACSQVTFTNRLLGRTIVVLVTTLFVARSVVLAGDWMHFDKTLAHFEHAFAALPDNSVIVTATAAPPPRSLLEWIERRRPPVHNAASLALLEKPSFPVNTAATPSQQPIVTTPAWSPLYRYQEQNPMPVASAEELQRFVDTSAALVEQAAGPEQPSYLLLLYPEYLHYPVPPELTRLAAGPRFILYRVDRGNKAG